MGLFGLSKPRSHDEDMELLLTTYDNIELSVVRSILEGENIPYRILERGTGGVMNLLAGYSLMGSDVLVPKSLLEKATELLEVYRNGETVEEEPAE